jgi:hypothetical protein
MDFRQYGSSFWLWNDRTGSVTEYRITRATGREKPRVIGYADNYFEFRDLVSARVDEIRYGSTFFVVQSGKR